MPVSKINWLFDNAAGFYLIESLLLLTISLFCFASSDVIQKLVAITFGLYFVFLLMKKYNSKLKLAICLLLVFLVVIVFNIQKENPFTLSEQSKVVIYPSQVQVKDNYLTGIGSYSQGKILLSGKLTNEQENLVKQGRPLELTQINGECIPIEPATNIGEFNYQQYYAAKKISRKLKYTSCNIKIKQVDLLDKLYEIRFLLQKYFKTMPHLLSFFASELVLGENNSQENQEVLNNYRDLGVIHLLSISGLHVAIYVLIISTLCFRFKLTDEETFIFCSIVLSLGIFLSNGQAGFVRASLTYILGKICKFRNYHIASVDLLGMTCIIHLLFVPRLFMSTGAILSYILAFGLQITNEFNGLRQSILLNLLLTPLLLLFFYQINLLTVLFNMIIVPYFNWIVMPLTFGSIFIWHINKDLVFLGVHILSGGEKLIGIFSQSKLGLVIFGQIEWWQSLILLIITGLFIITLKEKPKWKIDSKKLGIILLSIYTIFFSLIHFPLCGQVTFIDVGQGDSILITTPFPRRVYMIDTGGKLNFTGKKTTPQLNRITIPFLRSQGINEIDGVFVSHQDADHVGDLGPLLEQVKVKRLFMAKGLIKNSSFQKRLNGRIKHTQLIELLAGMQVKEPQLIFNVVYPDHSGVGKNEDSLSLFFKLANKNWLFTGDLDQGGESQIMQKFNLNVDYFKLGHHGSKTSSKPEFLQAIHPKMVFISAGRKNRFGHPHQETLHTLSTQQIPWVSTQDCGMISWYYGGMQDPEFSYFLKRGKK